MNKKLTLYNNNISNLDKAHKTMLKKINSELPVIDKITSNFGKSQSQFMDNMLTVSHPTPLRNIRQIMAEVNKSLEALKEAYYKRRKKEVKIKILRKNLREEPDLLEKELLIIEIEEKNSQLLNGEKYISGAIRKITNYITQYNKILKNLGVDTIDELDFELEEEKYHIKKSFEQALNAARSNQGRVDEGNQIYFTQIGINGTMAQKNITGYLINEEKLISQGVILTAAHQWSFLDEMYNLFKGSAKKYSSIKGMVLMSENALINGVKNE